MVQKDEWKQVTKYLYIWMQTQNGAAKSKLVAEFW